MWLLIVFTLLFFHQNTFSEEKNSISTKEANESSKKVSSSTHEEKTQKKEGVAFKPTPLPIYNMGTDWLGVRMADGVFTYKLKDNSKVIATFHLQKQEKQLKWKNIRSKDFFKNFVKRKQEWLRLINIRDWVAGQHTIKKRKNFIELKITGSYKKYDAKEIFFKEIQLFFENQVYQILIIGPNPQLLNTKVVKDFIKKAKKIRNQIGDAYVRGKN